MRVSVVTRIYSPEAAAAAFRLAALTQSLDSLGAEVTVFTTTVPAAYRGGPPAEVRGGICVRRAPVLRDRSGYVRGYAQYMSFDVPAFFRVLFSRRPDVLVVEPPPTTGFFMRMVCAIRRIPYVYYAADIWSDASQSAHVPPAVVAVVRWLERRALRGAQHVVAVSDGVRERVLALAPDSSVTVVRNGIDTTIFTPEGQTIDTTPFAVYAGTTSEWQGADIFIRAMPRVRQVVPDAKIVFLGQGSAWEKLRALAAELAPDAVTFHPSVTPVQAASWLRSARVGLVSLKPDQGYDFAVPTKIFAAVACGTPVLFAGPGPSAQIVSESGVGVATAYDVAAVADGLIGFFSDEYSQSPAQLAAWAREHVSLEKTAEGATELVLSSALRSADSPRMT